jgi:hypothetical protein
VAGEGGRGGGRGRFLFSPKGKRTPLVAASRVAKRSSRRTETGTGTPAPHYSALSQAIASRVDLAQRAARKPCAAYAAYAASTGERDERHGGDPALASRDQASSVERSTDKPG